MIGIVVGLVSLPVRAAIVSDLYSAKVVVPNQSAEAWDKALPEALPHVLVKLSGNPDMAKSAAAKQSLSKMKLWVKSYSYHEQFQQGESQLWLRFDFDAKPINQLLQQAHQSMWSNDRPLMLVWLEMPNADSDSTVVDAHNSFKSVIQQNADRRGLPILLPSLDAEGQSHAKDEKALTSPASWEWAFTRYGVKAVLVGQLKQVDKEWQAQWLLIANSDSKQWDSKGSDANEAVANGLNESANCLAKQLMPSSGNNAKTQELLMQVSDVQNLDDYAKISDYLNQLSFIKHVGLAGVTNNGMIFELKIVGDKQQLIQALSSSSELMADETSHNHSRVSLYYRWAQGVKEESKEAAHQDSSS